MDLSAIHFHDAIILKVVENTAEDTLTFEVDYPTNWDDNIFERRWLTFGDVLDYRVSEGPFHGSPTILNVQADETVEGLYHLRIDTNAGFRQFSCSKVSLCQHSPVMANKAPMPTGISTTNSISTTMPSDRRQG